MAASEGSSSRNLGEYAVSARSDLRSTANFAHRLTAAALLPYVMGSQFDFRRRFLVGYTCVLPRCLMP